MIPQLF